MSATSTNVARDTTAVDYLSYLRQYAASNQAGNAAGTNFTPDYMENQDDIIDITDSVAINGNNETQSDVIDITDAITQTSQNTGTFLIGTAKIGFADCA